MARSKSSAPISTFHVSWVGGRGGRVAGVGGLGGGEMGAVWPDEQFRLG